MDTVKVQLTDEERKHNRERLAEFLLNRLEINRKELIQRQNDPKIQAFVAAIIENKKKEDERQEIV